MPSADGKQGKRDRDNREWRRRATRLATWYAMLDEVLGWYEHVEMTRCVATKRGGKWLLVVSGLRGPTRVVCFADGPTLTEAYEHLAILLETHKIRWKPDKYPVDVGA